MGRTVRDWRMTTNPVLVRARLSLLIGFVLALCGLAACGGGASTRPPVSAGGQAPTNASSTVPPVPSTSGSVTTTTPDTGACESQVASELGPVRSDVAQSEDAALAAEDTLLQSAGLSSDDPSIIPSLASQEATHAAHLSFYDDQPSTLCSYGPDVATAAVGCEVSAYSFFQSTNLQSGLASGPSPIQQYESMIGQQPTGASAEFIASLTWLSQEELIAPLQTTLADCLVRYER